MRVAVYFNLHNRLWSIRDIRTGQVLGHATDVRLADVSARVSQAGRERVVREGRKNVHAFLIGTLVRADNFQSYKGRAIRLAADPCFIFNGLDSRWITYNPYRFTSFVFKDTSDPVPHLMPWVSLHSDRSCIAFI